jgi:phosphoribosylformylglycinamidine synthase
LNVSDVELEELSRFGIKDTDGRRRGPLSLPLSYLKTIRDYFRSLKRNPTDVELEALAQTWSEHCKHTIFASPLDDIGEGIYKTYIKGATEAIRKKKGHKDFCVSVFKDNSGGIVFDDEWVVTHKVETHNSPSALDPFGGAVTGIVGVNRDALGFGLGAKPVANTYGFCFALPEDSRRLYRDSEKTVEMLPSKRIAEGVIAGVNAGGNQSGIPTPNGFMIFDDSYRGKPLVFVGTVGIIPKKNGTRKLYEKRAQKGDYIVMIGGRVGLDGIHGATFSSAELDSGSPATSVQIGDPITQKKFSDAIAKEARDKNLYNSITDNGAGGLSSSVGEMAEQSGGARVYLDTVPLKYPGLEPWQIWISESQERMTVAVPKKKWKEFSSLMRKRDIEATVIGEFTDSGRCVVSYGKKTVLDIDLDFLHNGLPKIPLHTHPMPIFLHETKESDPKDISKTLLSLLKRHNLSSNEFISTQFDHEVQAGSVLKPLQGAGRVNADASVFKPVLSSKRGVVLSYGLNPYYSPLDPYRMAATSIDSAVRSAVAAGASLQHLAILDNFCWPSGNDPERLWQLKEAARACFDYAILYETPFISGKDSMFNDFKGYDDQGQPIKLSVLPTLLVSTIGVMKDAGKAVSIDFKSSGDALFLLGDTYDELGGSGYFRMLGRNDGTVPSVDGKKNLALYRALERAIQKELVSSSVSLGRGGLAFALLRSSMAAKLGSKISLADISGKTSSDDAALFSESQGRILVSVDPKKKKAFTSLFKNLPLSEIGTVSKGAYVSVESRKGKAVAKISLTSALNAYRSRFKNW